MLTKTSPINKLLSNFSSLNYTIDSSKSSSKRTVIIIRSHDRESCREQLLNKFLIDGYDVLVKDTSYSSVGGLSFTYSNKNILILFKPISGGMSETTLNASITEFFPCIAFELGYHPTNIDSFYEFIESVDVSLLNCVFASDKKALSDMITRTKTSSKYEEKIKNAIGITKFLYTMDAQRPICNVYWGYRTKPNGVSRSNAGDIYIQYKDTNELLGISLKAGTKSSAEPLLNTYVKPIFKFFERTDLLLQLRSELYDKVYSKLDTISPHDGYDASNRTVTQTMLKEFSATNNELYNTYYNKQLKTIKKYLINLINENPRTAVSYIKSEILHQTLDTPTITVKALDSNCEVLSDKGVLGEFIDGVVDVTAYESNTGKQDWFIKLSSESSEIILKMSTRTNKAGHPGKRKLGQFYNLSVKYNGLI